MTESEDELLLALYQHGPIAIGFDAEYDLLDYRSGVFTSTVCGNSIEAVNHAVVAVGYGIENGMDYWIIKNSWSPFWGDQGYFKMQRGVNMCGIIHCNSYQQGVIDLTKPSEFLQ